MDCKDRMIKLRESTGLNIDKAELNNAVAKIISAMVNKPRFAEAIQAKIGTAVDTATLEQQVEVLQDG